eukprot:8271475-Pyramimonas_sp.AAC.1
MASQNETLLEQCDSMEEYEELMRRQRQIMTEQGIGTVEIDSQEMRAPGGLVLPTFNHEDAMGTQMKEKIENVGPIDIVDDDPPVPQAAAAQAPTPSTSRT